MSKRKVVGFVGVVALAGFNIVLAGLGAREAAAQNAQRTSSCVGGTTACSCIIVDPYFGYCSQNGYPWEPGCQFQSDCRQNDS